MTDKALKDPHPTTPQSDKELEEQRKEQLENKRAHWSYDCIKRATSDSRLDELNIV